MAKVGRPKKVVDANENKTELTFGTAGEMGFGNVSISPMWNFSQPETREQFIERVAVEIVTNLRDYDTLKNGRSMATAAFNIATQLADLLEKRNPGD